MHEVDSYTDVYVDDQQITNAQITSVSGNSNDGKVTATKYANAIWIRRYAGTSTQTVDYILNNRYSSAFTSNFRGRGVAYAAMSYDWGDGKLFRGPPIMTFLIKGKKCYDPRLDASPGASPTNPSYIAWTSNPALCWADYAMADYGGSVSSTSIDWDSVVTAADVCDGLVNIPGATTQKRYTFNGRIVLPVDPDWRENAKLFIDAMMGRMVYRDGTWFCYAGSWEAASHTIEKTDWLSIDRLKTVAPRDGGRWNTVRCWYVDPSRNWQRVECFPRRNSTYRSADGAEEISVEMEQPACTSEYEAQRKAELMLRQSRNQISVSGKLGPKFRKIATGEMVAVNFEEAGWVGKTMRVRTVSLNSDGTSDVGLIEEQSSDWTDLLAAEYYAPSSSTIPSTNPTSPTAPRDFNLLAINGTLQFSWDSPEVVPTGTRYQIWYAASSLSDVASKTLLWEGDALGKQVSFTTNSPFWYQIRALTNSSTSDFTPNTYGIGTTAGIVSGGGSWSASVTPPSIYKSGGNATMSTPTASVTVNGGSSPTYTWSAVNSVGIAPLYVGSPLTSFQNTPTLTVGETRTGSFKCTVVDGVNSVALPITVTIYRSSGGGGGGGGGIIP